MSQRKSTMFLVQAAIIASLYAVLTWAQGFLLPGTVSAAIQFRVSEVMNMLALFTPAAIPGLTIGCLLANILSGLGAIDLVFGPVASFCAAAAIYLVRNIRIKNIPYLAVLMPAVFNGVIIGLEITLFFIEGGFHFEAFLIQFAFVALGELLVCTILGIPFTMLIEKMRLDKRMGLVKTTK